MSEFWSYADMLAFLSELGVDIQALEEKSHKHPQYLHNEIKEGEAIPYFHYLTKRATIFRNSARVVVRAEKGRHELVICKRVFVRDGFVDEVEAEWACSESVKAGDSAVATAIRGLKQELGLTVLPRQLRLFEESYEKPWSGTPRESVAYHGLLSHVNCIWLQVDLPERMHVVYPPAEDNGVVNYWRWKEIK